MAQHQPAPNGGEARDLPENSSKLPKKVKVTPITHTPLGIPTAKMPRNSSAPRQDQPHRR
jgi:hypothetical protein